MDMATLAREISTFHRLLPTLRTEHGDAWVVIVEDACMGAFARFEQAADFAVDRFAGADFLIRHTNRSDPQVPFLVVEA